MNKRIYSIEEISKIVEPVARSYGAERLSIFGSYARGEATSNSDIDFLLVKGKIDDFFVLSAFSRELQERFSASIDVLTTGALSDDFLTRIRKEEIPVYESH
jgi:predicted nucleotidyltransferase